MIKNSKRETNLKRWEVLRSFYVKKSPWVNWRIDTCRLSNGHRIEEYHVSEFPTGVGIVALTRKDDVVLVRQYRHGVRRVMLEIPGGMIGPKDRTPLDAARRELREETGYSSQNWSLLAELYLHPPSQDNLVYLYLARDVRRTLRRDLDPGEQIEVKGVPMRQVLRMVHANRVLSLGSTAALLLAREKMRI